MNRKHIDKNYETNLIECIKNINSFLLECYIKRYLLINNNVKFNKKDFIKQITEFLNGLPYNTIINKKEYIFQSKSLLSNSITKALENSELSDRKIKRIVKKINND